jgi:RNA polymerase sigma factor (sigma-70 family)
MATTINSVWFENSGAHDAIASTPFQNSPESLGSLYISHYHYVLKVCRHFFWHREDAEDAASEVFLKLHKVLEADESAVKSRSWLSKVTGRHCIDRIRHFKTKRCVNFDEAEADALPDTATVSPLSRVLRQEQEIILREQIRRLPRDYRILLALHYYREMSYAEIAIALGKQLPAIKTAIFRAKRMLRERILSASTER